MRMLDLFCGRWGWSKAFAARGWECYGIDLVEPNFIPNNCDFTRLDILQLNFVKNCFFDTSNHWHIGDSRVFEHQNFDFICASSPCEQFSVHGMKFRAQKNPPYPALGIELFEHTRRICEESGVPYVMENVRAAQSFVGNATAHCGPFYLWGSGVSPILPQGIRKGVRLLKSGFTGEAQKEWRRKNDPTWNSSKSKARQEATAKIATIPPELANCIADYAERICEKAATA
jgi:hypothetical protein